MTKYELCKGIFYYRLTNFSGYKCELLDVDLVLKMYEIAPETAKEVMYELGIVQEGGYYTVRKECRKKYWANAWREKKPNPYPKLPKKYRIKGFPVELSAFLWGMSNYNEPITFGFYGDKLNRVFRGKIKEIYDFFMVK